MNRSVATTSTKKAPPPTAKYRAAVTVGKKVKAYRLKQKLTLREVAERAKLSYEAVRLVETGRSGFRALTKVLQALSVPKAARNVLVSLYAVEV